MGIRPVECGVLKRLSVLDWANDDISILVNVLTKIATNGAVHRTSVFLGRDLGGDQMAFSRHD